MKLPDSSYDLFMLNLRMIEKMIKQARQELNNNDGLTMQIMMLQKLIDNMRNLQEDLKAITPGKDIN